MAASLAAAKSRLRAVMKQRLASLPPDAILAQSRRICETLEGLQLYRDASRISVFLSMPAGEVQTDAIVRHALGCGKQVFVPYLYRPPDAPTRVMDMVSLADVNDYESLQPDRWGIPSVDPATLAIRRRVLAGAAAPEHLDLMLVPGVAFELDSPGSVRRLGHGRGFYDRFLNTYLAASEHRPPLLLYGLALDEQLLVASSDEHVPVDVHDRSLHGLLLGSGQVRDSSSSPYSA